MNKSHSFWREAIKIIFKIKVRGLCKGKVNGWTLSCHWALWLGNFLEGGRKVGVCSEAERALTGEAMSLMEPSSPLPWTLGKAQCGMLHWSACGPCTGPGWSPCGCCFSVCAAGAGADGDPWWFILFFFPPPPPFPQGLLQHLKSQQRTSEKRGESLCSSSYFVKQQIELWRQI